MTEYKMTEEDHAALLEACEPVPYLIVGGSGPPSPQERANAWWSSLGQKMGFDYMTVQPLTAKGELWFTAEPLARIRSEAS